MAESRLRILLISPKGAFLCRSADFADYMRNSREMRTILHFWNGLGAALPTLAALTPEDSEVAIVDENLETIDFDRSCDIVGITAMTQQALRAYEIADQFRQRGRYVAIGGIHATVMSQEALKHADSVFVGEAENTWPLFLSEFIRGQSKQVYDQEDYGAVDMSSIPTPRYDLLASYRYPVVWLQSARGCPYDCEFCATTRVYGRGFKHKSVSQVVQEVETVRDIWRRAQIGFADDNMFLSSSFTSALLPELARLDFTWYAQSDISVARDLDLLRLLRRSGCRILLIGFESVSGRNLNELQGNPVKQEMFPQYAACIEIIQSHGIGVYGSFILGLDGDDEASVAETARFINSTNMMGAQITILTPFPGSRLRTRLQRENRILHSDWQWYTGWNVVIRHAALAREKLESGLTAVYKSIYSRESLQRRAAYFHGIWERLLDKQPEPNILSK